MSSRTIRTILGAVLAVGAGASELRAQDIETHPFPGMTYIKRTLSLPPFQCPGCPAPTPNPRLARINIVLIDLTALVLFSLDGTNGGHGMQGGEVADLLRNDYHVWNALNLDGGGSATMAMEDSVTHVRRLVNVPSDNPPRAQVAVVGANDAVSGLASVEVTVTSNETSDPRDPDYAVTPDGSGGFAVWFRAERLGGGSGRIYTITAKAKDLAGNVTTAGATCTVPHDRR